uniref:HORMA domain-containing protein 1 n=1 Tax=Laticauda laticaudata TaxID=8630 RepID=A0A8C5RBY1_LATLA
MAKANLGSPSGAKLSLSLRNGRASVATFPTKIATEQQSLMLVKRLLAISVSCITYLRGILPESAYGTRYLDGNTLSMDLRQKRRRNPAGKGTGKDVEKLEKRGGSKREDGPLRRKCYQFKFKYTDKGPSMDFRSQQSQSSITCADTKKASILLIRKIYILMQNLGPLPDNVCLTMKLFYYDEVTPPDYQPPGFKEGDCEGMAFEGEPMYLNVGEVPTPFHMLKVKVTTEKDRMECVDKEEKITEEHLSCPISNSKVQSTKKTGSAISVQEHAAFTSSSLCHDEFIFPTMPCWDSFSTSN